METQVQKNRRLQRDVRNPRNNPIGNAISSRAYELVGGSRTFYQQEPEERIRLRAIAARMVASGLSVVRTTKPAKPGKRVPSTVMSRPGSGKFRKAVLARDGRCVLTGTVMGPVVRRSGQHPKSILEVAHIVPYAKCTPDEGVDPDNGLTMTPAMHAAFDNAYFTIGHDGQVLVSRFADPDHYPPFIIGAKGLTDGMRAFLKKHRQWAMRHWNRWAF